MCKVTILKKLAVTLRTANGEKILFDGTGILKENHVEEILREKFEVMSYATLTDECTIVVYIKI